MTLLQLHHDGFRRLAGNRNRTLARMLRRLRTALGLMHGAIMAARLRRHEPMFHEDDDEVISLQRDVARHPQRPLLLGDKWDF